MSGNEEKRERSAAFVEAEKLYFDKEYPSAHAVCNEAFARGEVECASLLRWMFLRGHGCEQDLSAASEYFSVAMKKGDAEGTFGVGVVEYECQRYTSAARYFDQAFRLGYAPATRWLAVLYHLGLGVEKDIGKAKELYKLAYARGNIPAYYQYALLLLTGEQQKRDRFIFQG